MKILALATVLFLASSTAGFAEDGLPPPGCVRMLREARIASEQGDPGRALERLREATRAYPTELVPITALWQFHRKVGLGEEEARNLNSTLTARLADPASPLPPGVLKYLVENSDSGTEELQLVLKAASGRLAQSDNDMALLDAVAVLQLRLDMPEAARETMSRMLAVAPSRPLLFRCIDLDIALERWESAAGLLDQLLSESGRNPHLRLVYVTVLSNLGRFDDLLRQIDLIRQQGTVTTILRSAVHAAMLHAAWNLHDLGRADEAEKLFRQVLAADAENGEARLAILYLYSTEEEQRAHEAALQATWRQEDDPNRLLEQGANLLAAGDAQSALPLLRRAAKGLGDSEIAWFNLGLAELKSESWAAAEQALAHALRINPDRPQALLNHGVALYRLERHEEAIPDLQRALQLQSELGQAHYYLYVCYLALGERDAAARELELYNAYAQ